VAINKYPKLSEISAYRNETIIGHHNTDPQIFDGKKYGGFYTHDEIREVVKYAADNFITVVPEIEMPGHAVAALTAYPELSCTGGPFDVRTSWGISDDIFCAGNEKTFEFIEGVLAEVVELFPSKYIHIGGDEAPKHRWKECSKCQTRIKKNGLKDEHELQSYFITRIEKYLNPKGKQIIGWDEILEGGLAPNAAVMSWRGNEGGIAAAKAQHNVVMAPTTHCYFDYYQTEDTENEPLGIGGFVPIEKVYSFNPIPSVLTADESKYIMGVQANIWTEYMPTFKQVEYMAFPRISALAEIAWTNIDNKDFIDFSTRLKKQYKRFDEMNINYFKK
jgi:hexosaminidase